MSSLLNSRKFWLMVADVVGSLTLYFVGKYAPLAIDDVKFLIVTLQPVFVVLIGGIAAEDFAQKRAGN